MLPSFAPSIKELKRRGRRKGAAKKALDHGDPDHPAGLDGADDPPNEAARANGGLDEQGGEPGKVHGAIDRGMIYIAIVTSDSTVVYYKLTKGIKKPADIPDE